MADKIYEYMDWPRIEALVYGEEAFPRELLGPHIVKKGILVQLFYPEAKSVKLYVKEKDRRYNMSLEDEMGYFAALIPGKKIPEYVYEIVTKDGEKISYEDPYRFPSMLSPKEEKAFCEGVAFDCYKKLGAHPMRRNGVKGVYFSLWAPNAYRVSVVGTFNQWDGKMHPMHKSGETGIYEVFLPCAKPGDLYKFELLLKGGQVVLRTDPYAMQWESGEGNACVVPETRAYNWNDTTWMENRKAKTGLDKPLSIGQIELSKWDKDEQGAFLSYKELAEKIGKYATAMGYTHVQLSPLMEYPDDNTGGYGTNGYFAPTGRYGTPAEFKEFMDYLHGLDLGVIMDWTGAHFPIVEEGMHQLDGTCLYEYEDLKKKHHPFWATMMFNYASPMVREFLIGNSLYWLEEYHLDGLRFDDVDAMLYLDYGRKEGEWTPNIYGTNENLEAIYFIKKLSKTVKKAYPEALLIAQEDGLWPSLTGVADEEHMGFDFKWNNGWADCVLDYIRHNCDYRREHHDELTSSMLYAYCEDYILPLGFREVGNLDGFMETLDGDEAQQLSQCKAFLGYLMTHPGKKMVVGNSSTSKPLETCLQALLQLYKDTPALYELDSDPDGFQWIQLMEADKNMLVFLRQTQKEEDTVMVICNFSAVAYDKYVTGVPFAGKYKEVFNTDHKDFGGSGQINPRMKSSRKVPANEREDSLFVRLAPYSTAIFTCHKSK